ncbi:hypothetical protein A2955_01625 [Candidatus Woesebacteria bacterium RIFCSPLOWO2_01_FULL_37_19]|uniref:Uncharacterized protein n=2 Tax=Candidatus Woeseibacteriota TaxID=1752722 RepID=A0A1F8BAI1_9BACT|nr:MAG: hypothetical protein A2771_01020 [Candidatus Woesebacteria bacterium RIFCSPHIGHO2_01_FULL_38_26b]OGM61023.1 MAG: hypothetical protein A2955_01625 [Candidatus Woesebacteria bacterium RIFCSPLOWO2_01_FULL_37_19]
MTEKGTSQDPARRPIVETQENRRDIAVRINSLVLQVLDELKSHKGQVKVPQGFVDDFGAVKYDSFPNGRTVATILETTISQNDLFLLLDRSGSENFNYKAGMFFYTPKVESYTPTNKRFIAIRYPSNLFDRCIIQDKDPKEVVKESLIELIFLDVSAKENKIDRYRAVGLPITNLLIRIMDEDFRSQFLT